MYRKSQLGITLIELMTVVIIVTILASVAIPSYRSYLIRSQRSDAKTALLQVRAAQEKYYLQNNEYTAALTVAPPMGLGMLDTSENGLYSINIVLGSVAAPMSDQAYTVTATPIEGRGQQSDKKCTSLSLTDVGLRGATGSGGTDYCWR